MVVHFEPRRVQSIVSCRPVSLQGHDVHGQFNYIFNLWKISEIFHLISIHAVSPVQDIFFGPVEENAKKMFLYFVYHIE